MDRRAFMLAAATLPSAVRQQSSKGAAVSPERIASGQDRFGEHRGLGVSMLDFKLSTGDTDGGLFVVENTFHEKGGPARHLHHDQDEWFYALEGEFRFEIGQERLTLKTGDSVIGPRRMPHVWAYTGGGTGRILVAFAPAGKMEEFFRQITKANAMPPQDPALWRAYGMELLGPPLTV
jgi:quercetin dioxygenase-like cupin family protein